MAQLQFPNLNWKFNCISKRVKEQSQVPEISSKSEGKSDPNLTWKMRYSVPLESLSSSQPLASRSELSTSSLSSFPSSSLSSSLPSSLPSPTKVVKSVTIVSHQWIWVSLVSGKLLVANVRV